MTSGESVWQALLTREDPWFAGLGSRVYFLGPKRDLPLLEGLDLEKVLTFQYAGGSNSGLPAGGQWRCMFLTEVSDVQILDAGAWHTGPSHLRPQSCVDDVDVEIVVDAYGKPVPYTRQA